MKLQKFENVDVIASLEAIMKQNTAFYQSDFDIDKQILRKAAVSLIPEDKRLLWFSRPSGTCCFRERDVFLKDTRQHNTWRFYGEQTRDTILAYAVELTGTEQEKIKGNLYELDYLQHFREVIEKSIPADNYTLIYEHGELTKPAGQYFDGDTDPQLGKFIRFEAQPNDPEALKSLLREQQKKRTPHTQRDFQLHIAALHDRQIEIEARRIVENVKGLGEPDSPEKTHCAVELSPYFVPLATDKDMERLLSMLPYLTPGEPNHTLNHSCCVVPHEYFISWGIYGKTSRICFLQSSSFRMPSTLTMLHSFHYWIAIGFGSPHHYYPCLSV